METPESTSSPHGMPDWAKQAAAPPPSAAIPITGSALALASALMLGVLAVGMLAGMRNPPMAVIVLGLVFLVFAAAMIFLGVLGMAARPGPLLANAILCSVLDAWLLTTMILRKGRVDVMTILLTLVTVAATVLLYLGFGRARRIRAARTPTRNKST